MKVFLQAGTMNPFLRIILVFHVIVFSWHVPIAISQGRYVPSRTMEVSNYLQTLSFNHVTKGFAAFRGRAPNGVEIIVLRFDPSDVKFDLIRQLTPNGEKVDKMGARNKGVLAAFNGGFFRVDKQGKTFPVGLFARNKKRFSSSWKQSGGYLVFRDGNISILPTGDDHLPAGDGVLQSRPVLIEPGGEWAMNTNRENAENRTLVCKNRAGEVVVLAVVGGGLSLYEAGWLMRDSNVGGYFDCDSAIAMDGGNSTQIWVRGRPELSFSSARPVHNAVIVERR